SRSEAFPTPTTMSRDALSPAGATISSAVPFLPLKLSAAAARERRSRVGLSRAWVADPKRRPSSAKPTRTPRPAAEIDPNPMRNRLAMAVRTLVLGYIAAGRRPGSIQQGLPGGEASGRNPAVDRAPESRPDCARGRKSAPVDSRATKVQMKPGHL